MFQFIARTLFRCYKIYKGIYIKKGGGYGRHPEEQELSSSYLKCQDNFKLHFQPFQESEIV